MQRKVPLLSLISFLFTLISYTYIFNLSWTHDFTFHHGKRRCHFTYSLLASPIPPLYVICDLKTWSESDDFSNVVAQLRRYSKNHWYKWYAVIRSVLCMLRWNKQKRQNFNSKYDSYLTLVLWVIFDQFWNWMHCTSICGLPGWKFSSYSVFCIGYYLRFGKNCIIIYINFSFGVATSKRGFSLIYKLNWLLTDKPIISLCSCRDLRSELVFLRIQNLFNLKKARKSL